MQIKLTIGERLKDLRVVKKLTLEQLAVEVGISKSALGKYESVRPCGNTFHPIRPSRIGCICKFYGFQFQRFEHQPQMYSI